MSSNWIERESPGWDTQLRSSLPVRTGNLASRLGPLGSGLARSGRPGVIRLDAAQRPQFLGGLARHCEQHIGGLHDRE